MFKWLLKKKLEKLNFPWIEISPLCLIDYRYQVRGNQFEDSFTLQKKLNRNWYIGEKVYEDDEIIHKNFGMLKIIYSKKQNRIIGITNHRRKQSDCNVDRELKSKMNKIYGLR